MSSTCAKLNLFSKQTTVSQSINQSLEINSYSAPYMTWTEALNNKIRYTKELKKETKKLKIKNKNNMREI